MKLKFNLVNQIRDYFQLTPWQDIISWSKHNINFSDDVSSQRNFLDLQLTPHLREILQQWQFSGKIKEVTVCGIEQHRKILDVGSWITLFHDLQTLPVVSHLSLR